ncbi:hypothetical protein O3M35_011768 [Rhynocoris fuscipes]|uniref:Ribosomal protein S10 n=1 Tax=Rhynocoris fuscipes TaxID=488301 RepID=A0AAW1CZC1_9HEMI
MKKSVLLTIRNCPLVFRKIVSSWTLHVKAVTAAVMRPIDFGECRAKARSDKQMQFRCLIRKTSTVDLLKQHRINYGIPLLISITQKEENKNDKKKK